VFHYRLPRSYQYMRNWNQGYHAWAQRTRLRRYADPVVIQIYSEVLQKFRLAAEGRGASKRHPPEPLKERIATYFDPLPFYYAPLEVQVSDTVRYPLAAITQRPMAMYHSWDSQNAWLRQIHAHNYLFISPQTARAQGIADGDWIWVESMHGRVRCMCRYSEAVEPGTVWTWNAIGKARGVWHLAKDANESQRGFLLNHLVAEELQVTPSLTLPLAKREGKSVQGEEKTSEGRISNSDPITGQAGWYDVRVRVYKAAPDESKETWPQFEAMPALPGTSTLRRMWQAFVAGEGEWK
jgi:sulfite dehydrogenase (quinone) subunit SoeA